MQLEELKKRYTTSRGLQAHYLGLLEKREALYKEMIQADHEARPFLKKELRALDHTLDGLEEYPDLEKAKEALIFQIQQIFPQSKIAYCRLKEALSSSRNQETFLSQMQQRLLPFHAALQSGKGAKECRGVRAWLSGKHEKVLLAHAIQRAIRAAQEASPHIEEGEIRGFLTLFLREANQTWNGNLYKNRFYELEAEFAGLMEELEEKITQSRRNAQQIEEQIDIWIEELT